MLQANFCASAAVLVGPPVYVFPSYVTSPVHLADEEEEEDRQAITTPNNKKTANNEPVNCADEKN